MTYDINTLPQNELLKFLLAVKDRYSVDAIDGQKAKKEIEQQEHALLQRKQLEKEIVPNGLSQEEHSGIITTQSVQSLLSNPEFEQKQAPKEVFGSFLFQGEMGLLVGRNNETLSILAHDIAFFVGGGGHKWQNEEQNFESPNLPTLYIDMEMTSKQFVQRYRNAIDYVPKTFTRSEVDVLSAGSEKAVLSVVKSQIIKMQNSVNPPKFVIIDHISPTLFKNAQLKAFVGELKKVKEQYGLTVLLVSNCLNGNNKKPIIEDTLGTSKVLLNFVDSAFAIGTSFQDESVRYLKQVKCRECMKNKKVTTVQIKNQPYLSMWYVCDTDEECHTDPRSEEKCYYAFTPEEETELVEWLTRLHNGENISYLTISILSHIPFEAVFSYDMNHFTDTSD